jgi:ABC-2 type transport system ATP-binding protein
MTTPDPSAPAAAGPQNETAPPETAPRPDAPAANPGEGAARLALEVRGLAHRFKRHWALCGIDFDVEPASIHGFVGPNGAGKTTTLKVIATLLRPHRGTVRVFGHDVVREYKEVRKRVGFMPDHFSVYRQMTVYEYLDFFGAAYGMTQAARDRVIDDVLTLTDMAGRRDDLIRGLSRGMQQRVSLARVLVHDPDLLLLDEPASGLDPRARIELMGILRELAAMGKTVFISSHILSELADLCDSVTILDRGHARFSGPLAELTSYGDPDLAAYTLRLQTPLPEVQAALQALEGVEEVRQSEEDPRYQLLVRRLLVQPNDVLQAAIGAGGQIASFDEDRKHLNQAFLDLTEPGVRS